MGAGDIAQLVKRLPGMHEALDLISRPTQTRHGGASLQSQHTGGESRRIRSSNQKFKVILGHLTNLRPTWESMNPRLQKTTMNSQRGSNRSLWCTGIFDTSPTRFE